MVNLTVNRFYIQTVQSGPSTKTEEEKSINGIVMNLKFFKLENNILIHIFHCNFTKEGHMHSRLWLQLDKWYEWYNDFVHSECISVVPLLPPIINQESEIKKIY